MEKCILVLSDEKQENDVLHRYAEEINYEVMGCMNFNEFLTNIALLSTLKDFHINNIVCTEEQYLQMDRKIIKTIEDLGFRIFIESLRVKLMYIFKVTTEMETLRKVDAFIKRIDISRIKGIYAYGIGNGDKIKMEVYNHIIDIARSENIKTIYLSDSDFIFNNDFSYFVNRCIINNIQLVTYNHSHH